MKAEEAKIKWNKKMKQKFKKAKAEWKEEKEKEKVIKGREE